MKQILTDMTITDDDYLEYGDNNTLIKRIVGEQLYYHGHVGFELEFIDRNFNNQTQIIRISIIGNHKDIFWFRLKFTPLI